MAVLQQYAPISIQIAADINLIKTKESVHTKTLYNAIFTAIRVMFLVYKNSCLKWSTEVRFWDNTFVLIRSYGNEVYKVEKSKEDTREL